MNLQVLANSMRGHERLGELPSRSKCSSGSKSKSLLNLSAPLHAKTTHSYTLQTQSILRDDASQRGLLV